MRCVKNLDLKTKNITFSNKYMLSDFHFNVYMVKILALNLNLHDIYSKRYISCKYFLIINFKHFS